MKDKGVISTSTVEVVCSECKKKFNSKILIRNKTKVVYSECPVCRQKRKYYNDNVEVYIMEQRERLSNYQKHKTME